MAVRTHDDVDRALASLGAQPIGYVTFNNTLRGLRAVGAARDQDDGRLMSIGEANGAVAWNRELSAPPLVTMSPAPAPVTLTESADELPTARPLVRADQPDVPRREIGREATAIKDLRQLGEHVVALPTFHSADNLVPNAAADRRSASGFDQAPGAMSLPDMFRMLGTRPDHSSLPADHSAASRFALGHHHSGRAVPALPSFSLAQSLTLEVGSTAQASAPVAGPSTPRAISDHAALDDLFRRI